RDGRGARDTSTLVLLLILALAQDDPLRSTRPPHSHSPHPLRHHLHFLPSCLRVAAFHPTLVPQLILPGRLTAGILTHHLIHYRIDSPSAAQRFVNPRQRPPLLTSRQPRRPEKAKRTSAMSTVAGLAGSPTLRRPNFAGREDTGTPLPGAVITLRNVEEGECPTG
ncbi:hypothetical protein C0992_003903, partial [Termitomyces sp. T32_za158]